MLRLVGHLRSGPGLAGPPSVAGRQRLSAFLLAAFFLAIAVIVFPQPPAAAAAPTEYQADLCSIEEWQRDIQGCVSRLADVSAARAQCLKAPTPDAPDSGLGGWFATRPESSRGPGATGPYSQYGYAGYGYTTYDIGCAQTLMHPDYKFENTIANGELMLATAVLGASNALRERAWNPGEMWAWADPLVDTATKSIYARVFTAFGAITLAIVGLYLLWRSRQAQLSNAMTTAGWAVLVMVIVTAIASWPVFSAHIADRTLISSLGVVHDAIGPRASEIPASECPFENLDACKDNREPAIRASDTTVEAMLYRNWLRGLLGSANSATAKKYGPALYNARSLSWDDVDLIRSNEGARDRVLAAKSNQWMKLAEQIRNEDPEAYEYLTGARGMERIGAAFIALLASALFALFDMTTSLLVLLGFLIFRWAVVAAPLLGTIGMLRPASTGVRRLVNAVVAAIFNIVIFGSGAAIYLFAVDLIMSTPTLPGWLQVVLVGLCGVVGWLLLRPYRRITQLGGGVSAAAALAASSNSRSAESPATTSPAPVDRGSVSDARPSRRVEQQPETSVQPPSDPPGRVPSPAAPRRRASAPGYGWSEPESQGTPTTYTLYRPRRSPDTHAPTEQRVPSTPRAEARRES
jgi:hypothetical protein